MLYSLSEKHGGSNRGLNLKITEKHKKKTKKNEVKKNVPLVFSIEWSFGRKGSYLFTCLSLWEF